MPIIKVKGHEIKEVRVRNTFHRRALMYKNKIISAISQFGIDGEDIEFKVTGPVHMKTPASITWYMEGELLHLTCKAGNNYPENLYLAGKVIEAEIELLASGKKEMRDFLAFFAEDEEVHEERKKARELLGVAEDEHDLEVITKKYKAMAKKLHPDMPDGDMEKFKAVNKAHKTLQRELE